MLGLVETDRRHGLKEAQTPRALPGRQMPHGFDQGLSSALATVLNRLEQGVLLVDADAGVAFINRAAEELIGERRGLLLTNGVLGAERGPDTRALRQAVKSCSQAGQAAAPGHFLPIVDADGIASLSVLVVPVWKEVWQAAPSSPIATVHVTDTRRCELPSADQLRCRFGLTRAQAAFALEVVAGDGLQACAKRLGISLETARSHLHHVFEKTGTRRQAGLVRLILSIRPYIRAG